MTSDRPDPAHTETLRREAGVFFGRLTRDQQAAGAAILGLLNEIVAPTSKAESPPAGSHVADHFLPKIDEERGSRVLMIDGGRGSGKTSLLLTLLDALSAKWREDTKTETDSQDWATAWPEVFKRVVPVQVAELHPLPQSANLLLHLAGRLKLVVEAIDGVQNADAPRDVTVPWRFADDHTPLSHKRWMQFFKTVAGGWGGTIAERGGQLDPEAYALELEDSERRLLEVSATFGEFADALVADLGRLLRLGKDVAPILLLSVDDADMNPNRAVELLDLLRTLYHRNLIFLITGHSDLFMRMLRKHYEAALGAKASDAGSGTEPSKPAKASDAEFGTEAFKLAKAVYDKVIPPNQRCVLDQLSHRERIDLLQKFTTGVRLALDTVNPLASPKSSASPPTSGNDPAPSGQDARPPDADLFTYLNIRPSVGAALPGYLRSLIDLAKLITKPRSVPRDEPSDAPPSPRLAKEILVKLWADSLENFAFGEDLVSALERCIWIEEPKASLVVDGTRVRPMPMFASRGAASRAPDSAFRSELLVLHDLLHYWQGTRAGETVEVPEQAASAFMLAGWVAYDGRSDRYLKPYEVRFGMDWAFVEITYRRENEAPVVFYWYLPDWYTLDYLLFADAWAGYVNGLGELAEATSIDEVAKRFLEITISIAEGREYGPDTNVTWEALAARANGLAKGEDGGMSRGRREIVRNWVLSRAGLLAAPESGLSASAANAWLAALRSAMPDRDAMLGRLHDTRRERARKALIGRARQDEDRARSRDFLELDQKVTALIRDIDEDCREFAWAREVEREGRAPADFVEEAKRITVTHPPASGVTVPGTLYEYILPGRLATFQTAPASVRQSLGQALAEAATSGLPASQSLSLVWTRAVEAVGRRDLADVWVPGSTNPAIRVLVTLTQPGPEPSSVDYPAVFVYKAPSINVTIDEAPLSPSYLDALYRIRWDVAVDEAGASGVAVGEWPHVWRGLRIRHPLADLSGFWPAVDWPALFDWELFADHWDSLPVVVRLDRSKGVVLRAADPAVDTLGFQFLNAQLSIARSRAAPPVNSRPPSASQWQRLADEIANFGRESDGDDQRARAIKDWIRLVPSLAAPESGLSAPVAQVILSAFSPLFSARLLREARRTAAAEAGFPASEVDAALRPIDRANPEHPWVRQLERHGRSQLKKK